MINFAIEFIRNGPRRSVVLAAFGLAGILAACVTGGPSRTDDGVLSSKPAPLLWTAVKDGRTHYLFGTIHVGVDARSGLSPTVWEAFRQSDCFVMEADLESGSEAEVQAMATLPAGESLRSRIKSSTWETLATRLGTIPTDRLDRAEPWFATLLFLRTLAPSGEAMDGVLQRDAKAGRKRLVYLESWREALGAFARITSAADLDELVEGEDEVRRQTKELIAAYMAGDEAALVKVMDAMNEVTHDSDVRMQVLLGERNALWRPRVVEALASGHCFVAVGAAHLIGPDSLRTLLVADGFAIERKDR